MSNFDPKSPSYVPPGGQVVDVGDSFQLKQGNYSAETLLATSSSLATGTSIDVTNFGCRGALFMTRVSTAPGSASTTIALKINIQDPASPAVVNLVSRPTNLSGQATYAFLVYPGISASAGGVSCVLPREFKVRLSVSSGAAAGFTLTMAMSMMRIA